MNPGLVQCKSVCPLMPKYVLPRVKTVVVRGPELVYIEDAAPLMQFPVRAGGHAMIKTREDPFSSISETSSHDRAHG